MQKGQFDVVELMVNNKFKDFSINLNAQNVNGMTPFDLPVYALLDFEQTDIRNYFDF